MDIKQYLKRINYFDPIDLTIEVLSKLQISHLLNVPFENLDIHNSTKIDLTNLFNKIVTRKRGGFCYELNGLFYELLKEIGFTIKMISARVYDGKKNYSAEFDHMALLTKIEDDNYLVDVGFGDFAFYPIKIELNKDTRDPGGIFRIETFDETYKVVKRKKANGEFIPEYIFSEKERELAEFYDRCNYHQTSNESHFTQKKICSLPTKSGRITLTGNTIKITENGKVKEQQLNSEQQIQQKLWNYFGIKL
ncbi:MAG: arylamine N-acetyltransferase [Ginsengibacter sp.]